MRHSMFMILFAAACGGSSGGGGGADAPGSGDTAAIDITSSDVTLAPGQEATYCYYFHTTNTTTIAINKWASDMSPGSHHMILYSGGPAHADGLDMTDSCGLGTSATNPPVWVYAAQTLTAELTLPGDDGAGKPLAQPIAPNTQAAIQMHYLNSTDNPLTAHVHLKAYALADGAAYTRTDPYITYNQDISIGPGATGVTVSATCNVPSGNFWLMSTHSHKQSVHTDVKNAATMVYEDSNWDSPTAKLWNTSPFYTFGGQLTWECTYDNNQSNAGSTIVAGPSAQTNEMCMAVGYFFPSTGPKFCLEYNSNCYCN